MITVVALCGGDVTLKFSVEELSLLVNSLNEVCNGIDIDEFETRLGSSRLEATELLSGLNAAYDQIHKLQ